MPLPLLQEVIRGNDKIPDLTAANFPAQTRTLNIQRTGGPISAIVITVQVTLAAALSTFLTWGLINILKKVTLKVKPRDKTLNRVELSGASLFGLQWYEAGAGYVDASTKMAAYVSQINDAESGATYRISYVINTAHPAMQDDAFMTAIRSLIPCHVHAADPTLVMEFAPAAEISGTANPFSAVGVDVQILRADMPEEMSRQFTEKELWLDWELHENSFDLTPNLANTPKRFEIPTGGDHLSLLTYMHKGNATLTLADIAASTAFGSETLWQLTAGKAAKDEWTNRHRQAWNQILSGASLAGMFDPTDAAYAQNNWGPMNPGGALTNGSVQDAAVIFHDFFRATPHSGDLTRALTSRFGSPATKFEIVGNVTTPSNQNSAFVMAGRRYLSDIRGLKALAI
jgi:hypothetical protein